MGKVTISFVWAFIQKFGNTFLSFISNIILARLLLPEDYGAIGMIMIFIVISNTFIDGGFGSALIQKTNPTTKDYSTIFYWNIFFSIGLYIVLYFCAPFIASFYKLPLLNNLLKVLGVVLIINSLSVVQSTQLRKKLKFKECAYATVISSLLAVCVTVFLAYNGMGVWSLVIQQILVSVFSFLLYLYFNKWIPSLVFSWKSLKELFNFGFFMLCSSFLNNLCNNIQGLIIGRQFSSTVMGLYTQSAKLATESSNSIASVVDQVSYPLLVEAKDDNRALEKIIRQLSCNLLFLIFPLMCFLIMVAKPLIVFLFTEKWIDCVPYFRILCLSGIAVTFQGVSYNSIAAIGKSWLLFKWNLVKRIFAMTLIFVGLKWGVYGILWAMVVGTYVISFINMYLVSSQIDYNLGKQFRDIIPIVLIATCPLMFLFLIKGIFEISNEYDCYMGIIYLVLYFIISWCLKIEQLGNIGQILASIFRR